MSIRTPSRGNGIPYCRCSFSNQAAPTPDSALPPEMWSIVAAMLAATAGVSVGDAGHEDRDAHARGVRRHRRHHRGTFEAGTVGVADNRHEVIEHREPVVAELLAPPPELEASLESCVLRTRVDAEADLIAEQRCSRIRGRDAPRLRGASTWMQGLSLFRTSKRGSGRAVTVAMRDLRERLGASIAGRFRSCFAALCWSATMRSSRPRSLRWPLV